MARKSKYGNMPEAPNYRAKVKGDAGAYKVLAVNWWDHTVLLNRPEGYPEWLPIAKIAFVPIEPEGDEV